MNIQKLNETDDKITPSQTEAWERAKRMAFWDQDKLDYAKWLPAFKSGNTSVIRQSIPVQSD